ncbi:hypothetical protein [Enterovirga rhinocerotis]|uniref:Cobalt transporter subunit CbtB n=1 Tax=Enterovirga rhinocerotis TaxID=1339210 RepID=A0A4R7CCH2_9HYPH|nr:hypothetical protein [Enterovirga rhinocerotis]TDR94856.1 hypothetical protein EV668_2147 [Enterovirga rhinocerotis]
MAWSGQMRLATARLLALVSAVMLALAPIGSAYAHAGHDHAGPGHASHVRDAAPPAGSISAHAGCETLAAADSGADLSASPDGSGPSTPAAHPDCCWTWHVSAIPAATGLATKLPLRGSPIIAADRTAPPDAVRERLPEPPRPSA